MAQKTTVQFVDDLDDDQAADETITFALDGVTYQIDLSANHAATLREDLTTWTEHARRTGGRRTSTPSNRGAHTRPSREQTAVIRDWARSNSHQIADRGRIPAAVVDAFNAAH